MFSFYCGFAIVGYPKTATTNMLRYDFYPSNRPRFITPRHRTTPTLDNPIFLHEISQMEETDEELVAQFRQYLQSYLGLTQPIEPLTELKEPHDNDTLHDVAIINMQLYMMTG
jgi:hypothetical protein